ncbi:MAG: poly(hydroxyalkanoate) granule-associated protein [Candidatus Accumulibacter regalis]|jgi:Poly(hydroxyalcanoate) granule associated protein (phasin).|uniref:Poly(Hydroxyalkanoate) granule-associated protein n=1 Tax=Accumulibacter regalis TaxID=522306 RepID=A0A011P558_ACCRE|nr:phasin family protein [Accumulibacter sp.]EXI90058.1 MAG: poly(hydroxyalkanoate) granule-associated protein [Candidatus Accumulibacter regalis]MQM34219.1 hypothetical protein [Candidatus Accumulibacter phosphatis]MBL8368950.1 phasin family protein [Accumulibacter sp.]MBN8515767.1 phasin family protein [Accumulibacter sp.]MBO3702007.1 phasin family protein [Accumulibacter sp.]
MSKRQTTLVDRPGNEQFLAGAQESVRKLWLCGLGAYSLATRTSARAFATLVEEGKALRPKARRQIKQTSAELVSTANESFDRGERLFRDRLLQPLNFMVLASKRDVQHLAARLGQLTTEVRKLTRSDDAPAVNKSVAKTSAKPAVRPAAGSAPVSEDAATMLGAS